MSENDCPHEILVYCQTCGENPESTDESTLGFIKNHTEESCPAGEPVVVNEHE